MTWKVDDDGNLHHVPYGWGLMKLGLAVVIAIDVVWWIFYSGLLQ